MKLIKCNGDEISIKAADIIEKNIKSLKKNKIAFGICGGRSVSKIFSELIKRKIDWSKVHFFFVDERITKNKDELNFTLARKDFFDNLINDKKIKKENIHPFIFTGNIEKDIFEYNIRLTRVSYKFDIVLVSGGEDGHIASLFPDHPSIKESGMGYIHVKNSPKPPTERVSATRNLLSESSCGILIFSGLEKKNALKKFNDKNTKIEQSPAKIVSNIKDSYLITDII